MEVVNACTHHGFKDWEIANYFYEGLTITLKQLLDFMRNKKFLTFGVKKHYISLT